MSPSVIMAACIWSDVLPFVEWSRLCWGDCYQQACLEARNTLGKWRRDVLGAIQSGSLGKVTRCAASSDRTSC